MAVKYERIVEEDLNIGTGTVDVTMPGGGTAIGHRVGIQSFISLAAIVAMGSTQAITGGAAAATVQLDTEAIDVSSWFDPATYKFQPTVNGLYQVDVNLVMAALTGTVTVAIAKNGTTVIEGEAVRTAAIAKVNLSTLIDLDGDDDYITVTVSHNDGTNSRNVTSCRFCVFLTGKVLVS